MKFNIAVWWVLDYEKGERETLGGLERWTRDIVRELVSQGHEVCVYQKSKKDFESNYHGSKIFGISCSKNFVGNIFFYNKFLKKVSVDDITIFISQDLVWGSHFKKSLAINHGVWWSSKQSKIKRWALEYFNHRYISFVNRTICVDSNYINWVVESVTDGNELCKKMSFIPNYYDSKDFEFKEKKILDEIKVLFPRRIMGVHIKEEPRGGEDAIRAVACLIKDGYKIKLTMLGEGNLAGDLKKLIVDLGIHDHVVFETASFNDMHLFYHSHDVVLVPSRFSEGTSLSAIEGLACGCYVIGSCIGGLQNLPIFPPFGDMVEPNHSALSKAIKFYVDNRKYFNARTNFEQNLVVSRFEMKKWKYKIMNEINKLT